MPQRPQMLGDPILLDVARQLVDQVGDVEQVDVGPRGRQPRRRVTTARWVLPTPGEPLRITFSPVREEAQCGELPDLVAVNRRLEMEV